MPPHPCPGHRLVYPSGPGISVGPCGRVPASGLAPETSPESLTFAARWHSGWPHAEDPGEGSRTPEAAETEGVPNDCVTNVTSGKSGKKLAAEATET